MTKYKTEGQDGCDDCQWMAQETEGDVLCCGECANEISAGFQHKNLLVGKCYQLKGVK